MKSDSAIKSLNLKLHIDVKKEANILVDKEDLFSQEPFKSIYPQIFIVNQSTGEIVDKKEISPSDNGGDYLDNLIRQNSTGK